VYSFRREKFEVYVAGRSRDAAVVLTFMFAWPVRLPCMATAFPPHRACVHHERTSLSDFCTRQLNLVACAYHLQVAAEYSKEHTSRTPRTNLTYTGFTMAPSLPCECARAKEDAMHVERG
jgi:hypothetical protein